MLRILEMHFPPREIHFPYGQWRNFDSESSSNVTIVYHRRNNQNCFREGEKRSTSPRRILVLSGHAKRIFSWQPAFCSLDQKFDSPSIPLISFLSFFFSFSFFTPLLGIPRSSLISPSKGGEGMMDIYENPPSFNERLDTRRGYGRGKAEQEDCYGNHLP